MAGDAFGHDFALRAVTRRAIRFHRHENIGSITALRHTVTNRAIEWRMCVGIGLMFGVIEVGL